MNERMPTTALSIRQPWAWLILHAGKNIENRGWWTVVRGPIYLHAAKGMTTDEYIAAKLFCESIGVDVELPRAEHLPRGGIVGRAEITDCVRHSDSPWFTGPCGIVLQNPVELSLRPLRGYLGFFSVPSSND